MDYPKSRQIRISHFKSKIPKIQNPDFKSDVIRTLKESIFYKSVQLYVCTDEIDLIKTSKRAEDCGAFHAIEKEINLGWLKICIGSLDDPDLTSSSAISLSSIPQCLKTHLS